MAKKEYIERDSIYHRVKRQTNPYGKPTLDYESGVKVLDMIKQEPAADVVPRAAYEQMKWERDVAMQQLNDAGIPFCGETDGKRDEFFDRHLGKPVGECMCREERVIQNGRDESKEETQ